METDYWHSLDKENYFRINPKTLGVSALPTKKGIEQLKARVFEGARNVELGFMGKEKGNLGQGGITPEMHSKEEREEMRQMAKLNEVDLSTHTTVAIGGLAGLGEKGFSPEVKEKAVHEIQRTVDFAADVAGGGPVVVHTGEFPRAIMAAGKEFKAHPEEEKRRIHYLVDDVTGDIIKTIKEDEVIFEPEPKKDEKNNIVYQKNLDGTPKIILGKEVPEPRVDEYGNIQVKPLTFTKFKEELKKQGFTEEKIEEKAPKLFFEKQQRAEMEHSAGQAGQFEVSYRRATRDKKQLEEVYEQDKKHPQEAKQQLALSFIKENQGVIPQEELAKRAQVFAEKQYEKRLDDYTYRIKEAEKTISYSREIATASRMQAKQREQMIDRAKPIEEYGVEQSADALARSAIYAYDKERTMKLKKPLFVAPENVFPEQYGSHPQELKNLVLESRNKMVVELKKRGVNTKQAEKVAKDHIKATFDVGHANTWKKFFKGTDKEFKTWLTKQTEDLQKSGIIGHVHLSDNFGYYDEHLAPGEGNVPIKELIKKLEEKGYKGKTIVEGGAQTPEQSFRVWSTALGLSSSTYKMDGNWSWTDMQGSYFGRTGSPTYIVGDLAPSKDWTLWSETQLE